MAEHKSTLRIDVVGNGDKKLKNIGNQADKATKEVKELNTASKGLGSTFKSMAGLAAGAFALGAIGRFATESAKMWDTQQKAIADVNSALISTGGTAGKTLSQLENDATKLQNTSLFGDEDILKNATANLLTFTNIANEEFDRTQQVTLDLSTRMGTDLKSSALQLGKALNDPVKNLSALGRAGIQFKDSQIETIKALASTNRMAEAQSLILDELETQFGGAAKAAAEAGLGPMQQLGNTFDDMREGIGGLVAQIGIALLPMLRNLVTGMQMATKWISENIELIKDLGKVILVITGIWAAYTLVVNGAAIAQTALNLVMSMNPIGAVIALIAALTAGIVVLWHKSDGFRSTLKGMWEGIKVLGGVVKNFVEKIFAPFLEAWQQYQEGNYLGAAKSLGKGVFGLAMAPLDLGLDVAKASKGIGAAFIAGRDAELNKALKKTNEAAITPAGVNTSSISTQGGVAVDKASSTAGKVQGSKQTNININLNNLVEEFNVTTQNMTEGAAQVKDRMVEALLQVLNESDRLAKV